MENFTVLHFLFRNFINVRLLLLDKTLEKSKENVEKVKEKSS